MVTVKWKASSATVWLVPVAPMMRATLSKSLRVVVSVIKVAVSLERPVAMRDHFLYPVLAFNNHMG